MHSNNPTETEAKVKLSSPHLQELLNHIFRPTPLVFIFGHRDATERLADVQNLDQLSYEKLVFIQ